MLIEYLIVEIAQLAYCNPMGSADLEKLAQLRGALIYGRFVIAF